MGFGRGGWYSYDAIDMQGHSAREILPEHQELQVGQLIPVAPRMGFRVDVLDPERALVLYYDHELVAQQRATAEQAGPAGTEPAEAPTPGLKVAGGLGQATMNEFRVSWAFALEPLEGGRTRLLERFRAWTTPGPAAAIAGPVMDAGIFLMTRKQLLGIKERAEMLAGTAPASAPPQATPTTAN
jgi:hypothetical protein